MNVLLINPWITDFAAYDFWVKPLGLLYVGAFLHRRGHTVRLVDCMDRFQDGARLSPHDMGRYHTGKFHREIIGKPSCLDHVPRHFCRYGIPGERFLSLVRSGPKPDVVLVTCIMTYWYHGAFEAIARIRKMYPGVPVILGGIYAALCTEHAQEQSGADVVVASGTPSELIETVEAIGGGESDRQAINNTFGLWPDPVWELYDNLKTVMIATTRGCPLDCTVCASRILFNGFEHRDPVGAARSILELGQRGVEDVAFCDDALLLGAEHHAVPLFETLAASRNPVRLHSPNGLHVREITSELALLMKRAGVVTVRLSLETASPERLADFSSKVTRDEFSRAVAALYHAGFEPDDLGAYILVGLPGQDMAEVLDTVAFVHDRSVKVRPALFSPVPGTVEFEQAVGAGMIRENDDPVLQNNTLRTVDFFGGYPGEYNGFKKMLSAANERVAGKEALRRN